ncbi:hypothetical protein HDV05_004931 [Chytridiales sp. JEL 0842]|nr:hypothetical protein HDV05_004931 [Chytridiales sp. JEL 0842]
MNASLPFPYAPICASYQKYHNRTKTFVDIAKESHLYIIIGLTIIAAIVRLFRISNPSEVVFDEVHFGGFASKYINGAFFMDVHPPLGKLLISASAVLTGFDGSFEFKEIGNDYLEPRVPYVTMRLLPGILGVFLVPISYITMRNFGFSNPASVLTAVMVTFENGLATQSRLILLDSFLLFFTGLTIMMWSDFLSNQEAPFTFTWWYPLAMTGISLGLAVSVKWVGLFVIATIGLSTLQNLWILLGDLKVTPLMFGKHFAARALCLIVLPVTVYMALFQVHFIVLPNKGTGSNFMSPVFQATLKGNEISDTYADVAYGSKIFLRHEATTGGYLHSHEHNYPTGSKQQQITCYPFRDQNGYFLIKPALISVNGSTVAPPVESLKLLKHNDVIRLEHIATSKHLHSHDQRAPITDNEHHNEASAYGAKGFIGDTNDHWRVDVVNPGSDKTVKAIQSLVRLIHVNTGCQLFSHSVKLPDWGFGQQEVTCAKNGRRRLTMWRIEANENDLIPTDSKKINYKHPGFLSKFLELHKVMWQTNAGLTSSHPFESRPSSWPAMKRGISFWQAKDQKPAQIYLVGNPVVWWAASLSVLVFFIIAGILAILSKRQVISLTKNTKTSQYLSNISLLAIGWALHYLPFFLMKRQLFLHHYFPALYFSILLFGAVADVALSRIRPESQWVFVGAYMVLVVWVFWSFSPLTYGLTTSHSHCERLKWMKSWDFGCRADEAHAPKPAEVHHQKDDHEKIRAMNPENQKP